MIRKSRGGSDITIGVIDPNERKVTCKIDGFKESQNVVNALERRGTETEYEHMGGGRWHREPGRPGSFRTPVRSM